MDAPHIASDGTVHVPSGWWGTGPDAGAPFQLPLARVRTLGLVGCSKRKQHADTPLPAAELYTGALFRRAYRYSQAHHDLTFILSGRLGLVAPATPLLPYDYVLPQRQALARAWATYVARQLGAVCAALDPVQELYLYAGARYARPLLAVLGRTLPAMRCHWPVQGLARHEQVRWFDTQRSPNNETK
ncbi:MAG: hypothetical protein KKA73_18645 [Chloroflexi bacterium]|nr:hypothetical protein [Chloroflexota bacterium]MBU1749708.1 hypothetical protein [Chloroflexota bacterium]